MRDIFFVIFTLICIGCSLGVVFSRNPVYSAFNLVLCFFGLAGIYVLWNAPFIAMIQVLIYTGAIVVLFLFVVMLLDLVRASLPPSVGWWTLVVSGLATWFFSLLLLRSLNRSEGPPILGNAQNLTGLKEISKMLFSDYLWAFEVLSVFLLALIIAVYVLTRPESAEEMAKEESAGARKEMP